MTNKNLNAAAYMVRNSERSEPNYMDSSSSAIFCSLNEGRTQQNNACSLVEIPDSSEQNEIKKTHVM
jgi:hypothetical protein